MRRPSTGSSDENSEGESRLDSVGVDADEDIRSDENSPLASSPSSTSSLEFEDPEDMFYRDYRASQRSTYLVAHTNTREAAVRDEMMLALGEFGKLLSEWAKMAAGEDAEAFGIDLHDLSRENVFVDEKDHTKVVSRLFQFQSSFLSI